MLMMGGNEADLLLGILPRRAWHMIQATSSSLAFLLALSLSPFPACWCCVFVFFLFFFSSSQRAWGGCRAQSSSVVYRSIGASIWELPYGPLTNLGVDTELGLLNCSGHDPRPCGVCLPLRAVADWPMPWCSRGLQRGSRRPSATLVRTAHLCILLLLVPCAFIPLLLVILLLVPALRRSPDCSSPKVPLCSLRPPACHCTLDIANLGFAPQCSHVRFAFANTARLCLGCPIAGLT